MQFRTEVHIADFHHKITHHDALFSIGSCFSDNIGNKLVRYKFNCLTNPFGVLFNPISISNNILDSISDKTDFEKNIFEFNNLWHSWNHHGKFSRESKDELLQEILKTAEEVKNHLLKSSYIFVTLGTAWVYKHLENSLVVANCHKVPNKKFEKRLLTVEEVEQSLNQLIEAIHLCNPHTNFVFTVSPIRHWKDGAFENTVSKSHLFAALHSIVQKYSRCHYFPAYEMLIDDLRDYRFYASDMLHPSEQAIQYIWDKFTASFLEKNSLTLCSELEKVLRMMEHKTLQYSKENILKMEKTLLEKKIRLMEKYPFLKL